MPNRREQVIKCLIEGNSIRSTVRITGVAKNTVANLLVEVGTACSKYQDKHLRDLSYARLQLDENLTMRMSMRRYTCLTNGFSKKIENHAAAVTLYFRLYNFGRVHRTLKMPPAMKVGIAARPWTVEEVIALTNQPADNSN